MSATLNGHQAEINCVKFIDGRRIASGDQAGVLQIRSKIADKVNIFIEYSLYSVSLMNSVESCMQRTGP